MGTTLTDKVALVTGGGTGIGKAAALEMARAGIKLVITGRRKERLDEVVAAIAAEGGTALAFAADVANEDDAAASVNAAIEAYGHLDILVNAAGVNEAGGIATLSLEKWRRVLDINLWGTICSTKAAVPHLMQAGGGDIINISSTTGRRAAGAFASYSTSKFGVNGFSESIRQELGKDNIRVTVIEPGATATEIASSLSDDGWAKAINDHVTKDGAMEASDIAETILFILQLPRRANVSLILVRPTSDTAM
jgi:NADP-dependent 3-hydroxy acid dehydrogenase YdfG